ncbi:MAG: cysteine desulfurase-like protein [Candidatus Promineifilaceae bacterium]|nr:cysteine desulfurase-like protein [Candidatus Promineifilaceae bacterium]
MSATLDVTPLRAQFPSLQRQVADQQAIFLDGPGGTQTPLSVVAAMSDYLLTDNTNLGGAFVTSQNTGQIVAEARQAMAALFNAAMPEEIVFGQNMTSLTFAMSRAISKTWQPGDEIVVTRLDHDANITPWLLAAADRGVVVRWLDFDPTDCTLRYDELPELVNERTRLVAVTHASNAVGTIVDVARVAAVAREVGAWVYVDAVHYTPHAPVDVQAIDCDFLVASAYKFFGPHTGVLYGRYELLDILEAYKVRPAPADPPGKWETGTQSFESLAGVGAAVDYLAHIAGPEQEAHRRQRLEKAMARVRAHEQQLSRRFLEQAPTVPGLKVYGISDVERLDRRAPTFAVSLPGKTPRQVAEALGAQGIFVWDGHYYAVAVMERLGRLEQGGLVRIGFVHYNTLEEVDRLMAALRQLVQS